MSKLMAQLYEQLGINKIKTSIYHTQANGLVEGFNGTLKAMLKNFVGGECASLGWVSSLLTLRL